MRRLISLQKARSSDGKRAAHNRSALGETMDEGRRLRQSDLHQQAGLVTRGWK
jgi:hypothetical protein